MPKFFQKRARALFLLWCLIQLRSSPVCAFCLVPSHNFQDEGCACNFVGACSLDSKGEYQSFKGDPGTFERTYVPNVRRFANDRRHVVMICEPGKIGIIYDCENRIPLASTIVLTATDYSSTYDSKGERQKDFRASKNIYPGYIQTDQNYKGCLTHEPCYRNRKGEKFYDQYWYRAVSTISVSINVVCGTKKKTKAAAIHTGHLVAAQYGRGGRVKETFVFTNAVPQFGVLNTGQWNQHEQHLIIWAKVHCVGLPLHIITGSVPSAARSYIQKRFFGQGGFSDYQETSADPKSDEYFAVNVPRLIWTAACCGAGTVFKNTGFYARNFPSSYVYPVSPSYLINMFRMTLGEKIKLFPRAPECQADTNYQPFRH